MTTAAASGNALLDAHVRLIRATADLVEQSGIPGLVLCPGDVIDADIESIGRLQTRVRAFES